MIFDFGVLFGLGFFKRAAFPPPLELEPLLLLGRCEEVVPPLLPTLPTLVVECGEDGENEGEVTDGTIEVCWWAVNV